MMSDAGKGSAPWSGNDRPLAPWGLASSLTRGRRHPEPAHALRGPFERDRDRVIHSGAFRRLIAKTQVFVGQPDDLQRTRLTHTLEVAQIARTIARRLGLNEDLTEAIALAHDLGHPPFGHAGERALNEKMQGEGGFEHNRQGVRLLERLERPYPEFPGLNLSFELLECLALRSKADHPDLAELRSGGRMWLEGQAVDAADSIAYNAHDAQDALRAGLISLEEIERLDAWKAAVARAKIRHRDLGDGQVFIASVLRGMLDVMIQNVVESSQARLKGMTSPRQAREAESVLIRLDHAHESSHAALAEFLKQRVYRNEEVLRTTSKCARIIGEMFDALVRNVDLLPASFVQRLEHEATGRVVCDFLACMTDRYALRFYREHVAGK